MNVASLELSQELCNVSSWGDDTEFVYYVNGGQYSGEVYHRSQVMAKPGNIPAYDLGYLLDKLPKTLPHEGHIDYLSLWADSDTAWNATYELVNDCQDYDVESDTLVDATAKLAIKLFKQKILTRDGGDV